MRQWIQTHPAEVRIFCLSFVVHLIASFFLYHKFGDNVLSFENEDALGYIMVTKSLIAGMGFARAGIPSALRTPLLPLFLVPAYLVPAASTWIILVMQNIVASVAGVFLYRLGKLLFGDRVGRIAGFIYVLEPYMLMTANLATTETLFNCLIIIATYFLARFFSTHKKIDLALSGAVWGLATLTRPVGLYIPVVLVVLLAAKNFLKKNKGAYLRWLHESVIVCVAFVAILAPWSIRQHAQFGTFRITSIDAILLYFRIAPIVVSAEEHIDYQAAILRLKTELIADNPTYTDEEANNSFRFYHYMTTTAKKLIARNPTVVAEYYALSLVPGLFGTGYEYMLQEVFGLERATTRVSYTELLLHGNLSAYWQALTHIDIFQLTLFASAAAWVLVYLLIFWALLSRLGWSKHALAFIMIMALAGYFVFFALGPQSHARYRMPSFPFLYLLLGYAIVVLHDRVKHKKSAIL